MWDMVVVFVVIVMVIRVSIEGENVNFCMIGFIKFVVVNMVIVVEFWIIFIEIVMRNLVVKGGSGDNVIILVKVCFVLELMSICLNMLFVFVIRMIKVIGFNFLEVMFLICFFDRFCCFFSILK